MSLFDEEKISAELKGNTLRIYWALLNSKNGVVGVRELQRKLGFSSPALASYHLNKLTEMKLVEKERGDYRLIKEVRVGVLKQFIRFGAFLLPRYVLYSTMFTTLLIFFVTQIKDINFYSSFALVLGILSSVVSWYETISIWRQKP
jgi:DNA-binding transcriptional ArsR family regulator